MNFDELSKKYDTHEAIDRAKLVALEIKETLENKAPITAMEFGGGTGLLSLELLDKFKSIDLVDVSKGMLEVADEKIRKNSLDKLSTVNVDLVADPLNKKYDVIYTSMALHHVKDVDLTISALYEHLNDNGEIFIIDLNEDGGDFHYGIESFDGYNGFNQEDLKSKFKKANFKDINAYTFFEDEKVQNGKDITYSFFLLHAKK
ncbi:MAG: class I SAM-dependent DNA methyltransferase [Sarcina sp.]